MSNVSFGLPLRSLINQAFLAQALRVGLDAAVIDPLDQGVEDVAGNRVGKGTRSLLL